MGCNQGSQLYFKLNMLRPSRSKKVFILEHLSIVNLDTAVMTLSFRVNIDICDTVRNKEVTKEYGLGQNGGFLT
jgi:hypothetical protein